MNEKQRPTIETERLRLRPFTPDDAPEVQRLAGDREIASTTMNIPHPYEDGMAEQWIATHQEKFESGERICFAVTHREQGFLIGAISLIISRNFDRGELGYWIGKLHWNKGYCTEAVQAMLNYGFEAIGLNRIHASYFARNPASGRVMQKAGMKHEGHLRQHVRKWGSYEDMVWYGILRSEYKRSQ